MQFYSSAKATSQTSIFASVQKILLHFISALFILFCTQSVFAEDVLSIDIAASDLGTALNKLAADTGTVIYFDASLTRGKTSQALKGEYTVDSALFQLLQGSSLEAVGESDGSYRIVEIIKNSKQLEPISVTGELQQRTLQESQTSVTVLTGEELDRSAETDLFNTVERLPNVNLQPIDGQGSGLVIRGISNFGVSGTGSGEAISFQVDGVTVPGISLFTGPLSSWDLEQVEVLRGPQSTQQGPNSLAGAFIIRSKDPVFDNETKARFDFGEHDELRGAAVANAVLGKAWAVRFSAEGFRTDGDVQDSTTGIDLANQESKTFRGKLRYKPNEKLDVVLGFTHANNEIGIPDIMQTGFPGSRLSAAGEFWDGDTNMANLRINYQINQQWSVYAESGYLNHDLTFFSDFEPFPATPARIDLTGDREVYNQELKLNYDSDKLNWVAGMYYRKFTSLADFDLVLTGVPLTFQTQDFNTEVNNIAGFTEVEYEFLPSWRVIAGLRYDTEKQETNRIDFTFPAAAITSNYEPDYSALLPKLSLVYDWTEKISTGFTAQRGYRAGGGDVDPITLVGYTYEPEYMDNYEFSFRSLWLNDRLLFNANLFYTKYKDMQVVLPGPLPAVDDETIENAGEATLWGFEIQSSFDITRELNLFANVGYTKTEFDEFVVDIGGVATDLAGNEFSAAPRWTASTGAKYYFRNGFEAQFDINYTDNYFDTEFNLPTEVNKAFTLVNARIGYQSEGTWSAYIYARNLLDNQYLTSTRADGFGYVGEPRVVGVSLFAEF